MGLDKQHTLSADLSNAIQALDTELRQLHGEGLYQEQRECLEDTGRYSEALEMLDDMESRMGISGSVRGDIADALTQRELQS